MKTQTLLSVALLVLLASCGEDAKIDEKFIVITNSEINNSNDLSQIQADLKISSSALQANTEDSLSAFLKSREMTMTSTNETIDRQLKVLLKSAVDSLFDPENSFCELPKKVKANLSKLKKDGKSWAPSYVANHIRELPDTAFYLPRTSIAVLLHSVTIKSPDRTTRNHVILGSPTFKNFDVETYILKQGYNSFFFSLDCSGYLNAAIEGSGAIPGADIKASAKSALDNKKSMFIAGGLIISPIAAAYYGNSLGIEIDSIERKAILNAITTIPDAADNDTIYASVSYEAIWMSKEGSSSFNGSANFAGGVDQGIGIAKISAGVSSGGTISRNSSFNAYRTYFTSRKIISDLKPFTIQQVKDKLNSLN